MQNESVLTPKIIESNGKFLWKLYDEQGSSIAKSEILFETPDEAKEDYRLFCEANNVPDTLNEAVADDLGGGTGPESPETPATGSELPEAPDKTINDPETPDNEPVASSDGKNENAAPEAGNNEAGTGSAELGAGPELN